MNIAVLVSGGGTNLQALIDYQQKNANCPYKIVVVISDHKDAFALQRAQNANIPHFVTSPYSVLGKEKSLSCTRDQKRLAVSNAMLELVERFNANAIVEAGCLTVLAGDIVTKYENKIINLHPALLPKFGGVGMFGHHVHEAVLASGEKESGCTVHLVDTGCDTGKILVQKKVPVMPNDTVDSLYARIAPMEHEAIIEGVCMLAKGIQ